VVKRGERILEGVAIQIDKIQQLLTPNPTVSDKDSPDVAQKIRYLIDVLENVRDRLPASKTASDNLKIALVETNIKQPTDIQDHWQESVALVPSGARTASGNTADIDVGRFICAEICLDVTAVSGTTPTLDVYIEGKDQVSGKYKTLFSQTGINAVGTYWFTITTLAFKYIRVRWVISGTSPSFTFSVGMEGKS
jgi:hypothetical protein